MFGVVTCNKYNRKTLRIADIGERGLDEAQRVFNDYKAAECPVCGPLTHSELDFTGYIRVHSIHETLEGAFEHGRKLYTDEPGVYRPEFPDSEMPCCSCGRVKDDPFDDDCDDCQRQRLQLAGSETISE